MSLEATDATEPVKSPRFMEPYPTTITSSKVLLSGTILTFIGDCPVYLISWVLYPIYEKDIIEPFEVVNVKFPSKSVIAPVDAPFTITVAPISGVSVSSTTTPFTVMFWACKLIVKISAKRVIYPLSFIDLVIVLYIVNDVLLII